MILWIFLFILVLVIIFLILFFNRVSICFSSPRELYNYIETNHDFYKTFSSADFKARNIETIEEYLGKIQPEISCFTWLEKIKILYCIYCADYRIRKIHFNWYRGKKAANIPWKIGCVDGKTYEQGLPHTIKDMIIIYRHDVHKSTEELIKTLIHENVHLYQKRYPEDTLCYLSENGFSFYKKKDSDNSCANPDTDHNIYQDDTKKYKLEYNSSSPSSISDVTHNRDGGEHPFEKMAYTIQNLN